MFDNLIVNWLCFSLFSTPRPPVAVVRPSVCPRRSKHLSIYFVFLVLDPKYISSDQKQTFVILLKEISVLLGFECLAFLNVHSVTSIYICFLYIHKLVYLVAWLTTWLLNMLGYLESTKEILTLSGLWRLKD